MIRYKTGDLMQVQKGIIAHGCNCRGVMGSGVAKLVKHKYPKAYERYSDLCQSFYPTSNLLGIVQLVKVTDFLTIGNLMTQNYYGTDVRQVSYDAVDKCFRTLVDISKPEETIHIPKIGAGLGGGDWDIIEIIINKAVGDRDVICWTLEN